MRSTLFRCLLAVVAVWVVVIPLAAWRIHNQVDSQQNQGQGKLSQVIKQADAPPPKFNSQKDSSPLHSLSKDLDAPVKMNSASKQQAASSATSVSSLSTSKSMASASSVLSASKSQASSFSKKSTAIVILTFNRPDYLKQTIDSLLQLPGARDYTLVVSQDGDDGTVKAQIDELEKNIPLIRLQHSHTPPPAADMGAVYYIAQHYKFALDQVLHERDFQHAIVLEDDLVFSPDFLRMFESLAWLLDADPSLWCISSWNDNGFKHLYLDPTKFMRTNYFPGLGWMLKRSLWQELRSKFPAEAWDHWMRTDGQHKGRDCIVPMLSRNHNIGKTGSTIDASSFEQFLANIDHNTDPDVSYGDTSYLVKQNYDKGMREKLQQAAEWRGSTPADGGLFASYVTRESYKQVADSLRIFPSPRTYYSYVVELHPNKQTTLFIADTRRSEIIPSSRRVAAPASLTAEAGGTGENCHSVCSSKGKRCEAAAFDFVNTCAPLLKNYACEKGCDYNVGEDIPVYVSDGKNARHWGKCLVTDAFPTCQASHWSTSRICPCV